MENVFIQIDLVTMKELAPQAYNGLQIYLAIKGDLQIDVNKNRYLLTTNDVLVINCHDMYSVHGNDTNIALVLKIPFEYLRRECEDMLQYTLNCCSSGSADSRFDEIRRLLIYIMMIYSHMDEGYRLNVRANLFQLLHYLLLNFKSGQPGLKAVAAGKKDSHIASVIDYINENYKQSITLEELAKREFMSIHYLSKLFKNQVGIGFLDYISNKRLDSAVTDLIYTDESILNIALQNGFANAKSFYDVFKKRYDDTPNQFRQRYQKKSAAALVNECISYSVEELEGLGALVKYLKLNDEKVEKNETTKVTETVIDLDAERSTIEWGKRIVIIGQWSEALKRDTQEELELLQKEIGFDYVYFKGIFADGIVPYEKNSNYGGYEYIQSLLFFERIGLIPFIQINLSDASNQFHTAESACEAVKYFLLLVYGYFAPETVEQWKFEFVWGKNEQEGFCVEAYHGLFTTIKRISVNLKVGYAADSQEDLKALLEQCLDCNCPPDFITFAADPNREVNIIGMHADAYTQLRGFHVRVAEQIKDICTLVGLTDIELYLMRWNTVCGQSDLEASSYYRAALISETMLELNGHINGLAVWLSEKVSEQMRVKERDVINLFHCRTAKRAANFVLEACSRLGSQLIYKDDNLTVTENRRGEYVILVSNPCYFNPLYALDYNFIQLKEKHFHITLKGLEKGLYRFKVFQYVMNFSFAINDKSSIHALPDVEIRQYSDTDLINYVQSIACPEFATYEEEISETYTLNSKLSLNAVSLYILNRRRT